MSSKKQEALRIVLSLEDKKFNHDQMLTHNYSSKIYNRCYQPCAFKEQVVDEIVRDGISIRHIKDFNSKEIEDAFADLQEYYVSFRENKKIQQILTNKTKREDVLNNKFFEVNSEHFLGRNFKFGDGVVEFFLSEDILQIASRYLQKSPKLFTAATWIHRPQPGPEPKRVSSMNWHKDPEAFQIFKVYILMSNVGEQNGPFQYIKGTHSTGKYNLQDYRISNRYPDSRSLEKTVNKSDIISATGPKGTIIFCDNFGFHRGGYVLEGLREMAQGVFLKPNVLKIPLWSDRQLKLDVSNKKYDKLSTLAKYAINFNFYHE